jgi:hypothetical protein
VNHELFGKDILRLRRLGSVLITLGNLLLSLGIHVLQTSGVMCDFRTVEKEETEMDFLESRRSKRCLEQETVAFQSEDQGSELFEAARVG